MLPTAFSVIAWTARHPLELSMYMLQSYPWTVHSVYTLPWILPCTPRHFEYFMYILALYGQTDILNIPIATYTPLFYCVDRQTPLGIVHVHVAVMSMDSTLLTYTSVVILHQCTSRHLEYYIYILLLYRQTDILNIPIASHSPPYYDMYIQSPLGTVYVHVPVTSVDSTFMDLDMDIFLYPRC